MNEKTIMHFAGNHNLIPVAFFKLNYPAYSVKIKYKVPTNDPLDFQERALLRLIGAGISYKEAAALLLINDPHNSILKRFKSGDGGSVLVAFDETNNRDNLTKSGEARVERPVLTKTMTVSGYVDGSSGTPFPRDVVKNLENGRFHYQDIDFVKNADYPFDPEVEGKLQELETSLNEGSFKTLKQRLNLPDKALEIGLSFLECVWITDLSMGIFLKNGEIKRYLFCGDSDELISPFGYLAKTDSISLVIDSNKKGLGYKMFSTSLPSVFEGNPEDIKRLVYNSLVKTYGEEQISLNNLTVDMLTGRISLQVDKLSGKKKHRIRLLSDVENREGGSNGKYLKVRMPSLQGCLYVKANVSDSIKDLSALKKSMEQETGNWLQIVSKVKENYPDNWRKALLDLGRKDLLFLHDKEKFIRYHHE